LQFIGRAYGISFLSFLRVINFISSSKFPISFTFVFSNNYLPWCLNLQPAQFATFYIIDMTANTSSALTGMQAYRAPSLFQPHNARQAIRDAHTGKIAPLRAFWNSLPSVHVNKLAAQAGFDLIYVDWEHSGLNTETMTQV
jgi:hypothetical protein